MQYKIRDMDKPFSVTVKEIRRVALDFPYEKALQELFPEAFEIETEEGEPRRYPYGTRFKRMDSEDSDEYMLVQIASGKAKLISMKGDRGNRYSDEELTMKMGLFTLTEKYKDFVRIVDFNV